MALAAHRDQVGQLAPVTAAGQGADVVHLGGGSGAAGHDAQLALVVVAHQRLRASASPVRPVVAWLEGEGDRCHPGCRVIGVSSRWAVPIVDACRGPVS